MCVFQIGVFNSFFKSILIATSWYACFKLLLEEMLISLCIPLFLGMLPLLGSSTSDPEEELEELRMKLQIMKGE